MTGFEATCGTTDFPELCSECRQPKERVKVGKGKAAKVHLICTACEEAPAAPVGRTAAKRNKDKGTRVERNAVNELTALGLRAFRQPSSGAFGSRISESRLVGDLVFECGGERFRVECKARTNGKGFQQLETWQGENEALLVKRDRQPPQVVLTWDAFKRLVKLADGGRA